jgi:23S rRNA (guanosine2251-2'-O)-methyltransferase
MTQIVYGIHPVEEALRSPHLRFEKILIAREKTHPQLKPLIGLALQRDIPIDYASREAMDGITRGGLHQNVVAILQDIPYATLEEILIRSKREPSRALLLILDGIQDPQNLGSLIRTASGCGVRGVVIPKDRAVGITPAVVKISAGAATTLPIAQVVNIASTLDALKKEGFWVYGAAGEAEDPVFQMDFNIDVAVVIGGEGKGIRPLVKKRCDRLFSIPMRGPLSSFNAAVAGGMILYEVMRQRTAAERQGAGQDQ